jgi:hypothetical protein
MDLLLLGCFVGYMLAVIDPLLSILAMFISGRAVSSIMSLIISFAGTFLVNPHHIQGFVLYSFAGAFTGSFLLAAAERLSTYKPVLINQSKN